MGKKPPKEHYTTWTDQHYWKLGVRWPRGYVGTDIYSTREEAELARHIRVISTSQPVDIAEVTVKVYLDPDRTLDLDGNAVERK